MISPDLLESKAASYQDMTDAPQEVVKDILAATDHAYTAYLESPGGRVSKLTYPEIKQSPNCMFIADRTSEYLAEQGYRSDTMNVYFPCQQDGKEIEVFHLVSALYLPEYGDDPIIADGTWQQFLPHSNPFRLSRLSGIFRKEVRPDVLIGTSAEIAKIALGVGFSKKQSHAWHQEDAA